MRIVLLLGLAGLCAGCTAVIDQHGIATITRLPWALRTAVIDTTDYDRLYQHTAPPDLGPDRIYTAADSSEFLVRVGPDRWYAVKTPPAALKILPSDTSQYKLVTAAGLQASTVPPCAMSEPRVYWPTGQVIYVQLTAYASVREQTDDTPFEMATGDRVFYGAIAHNTLPFGTIVRFPEVFGDRAFVVKDRMNARYDEHFADIWMPSNQEALDFRVRRNTPLEIVSPP